MLNGVTFVFSKVRDNSIAPRFYNKHMQVAEKNSVYAVGGQDAMSISDLVSYVHLYEK
jgi:hypothetical protein